ncbi:hypothetical protein EJ02DRAFT_339087 [Clathrospora elynae]|uniref:Uncharacterized protein n=1 Tax=Clathrospora elynae TaxID=706981 RepID=A0A6A5SZP5_9PLEO|nr:hypothetical protein EJ02DRAFT_339087 [Clathrospora elynae]
MSTSHHHTSHPPSSQILDTLSRWHSTKREANLIKRLGMRTLEIIAIALAMLVLPATIHRIIQSLDGAYDILGRTARSPHTTVPWISIVIAAVVLLGWHVWLVRLSYMTIVEDTAGPKEDSGTYQTDGSEDMRRKPEEGVSWGRVLGRIVIPSLLLVLGVQFTYQLLHRTVHPKELVTSNMVDMQEAVGQLYGFQ